MEPQESHTSRHISKVSQKKKKKERIRPTQSQTVFVLDYDCGKQ